MYHRNCKFESASDYSDASVASSVTSSVSDANSEDKYVPFGDENMSQVIMDIGDA